MPVHVSIHDVSPIWSEEIEAALDLCAGVGARPALLVVPDFHGTAPILENDCFCERLRDLQHVGHEIHLHGFQHRARELPHGARLGSRVGWAIAQSVLSAGEAELAGSEESEGRPLIVEGERVLREAGLRVDGFVAPAWAMPRWLLPALASRGYRFTEDRLRVYDPVAARSRATVVLNWASRSRARLLSTVAWCRLARHAHALLPARIAIHPADMRVPLLRREIADALDWARGDLVERSAALLA
jgi:predicted deacetylase